MAEVPVTLNGVLFPKGRSASDQPIPCTFVGSAWYSDLSVGGGPIYPPSGGGKPPIIWGGPIDPYPDIGGPGPQPPLPPSVSAPQPGDPTVPLPPPAGSAGWPAQSVVPPSYIVVNYPGIGPVVVSPPAPVPPT